ncbi:MAG: hypothetical protein ACXABF_11405 [Candidatus Thorarchaeota archaeon]|jgi:hypothetical protein
MNIISEIFDRMDKWRNLPKYGLERRADIFFGVYLKTALEAKYKTKIKEEIIPEFPVHLATIYPSIQTNQSVNVDFLAFSEDNKIAFLIELKTDLGSRRKKQDDYLIAAADKGLVKLIQGLFEIFRVTNKKRKYFHLFKMLEDAGIIELPSQLQPKVFSKNMSGVMAIMRQVKIITPVEQTKVVYLQPTGVGKNVITFNEFGSLIEGIGDPITQRVVKSLKTWSEINAGDIDA